MFQKDIFFESSLSFNLTDPLKVLSIDVSHEIFDWWWHHNINGKTWRYRGSLVILQRSSMKGTKKDFPFLIFNLIGLFYKKYMKNCSFRKNLWKGNSRKYQLNDVLRRVIQKTFTNDAKDQLHWQNFFSQYILSRELWLASLAMSLMHRLSLI